MGKTGGFKFRTANKIKRKKPRNHFSWLLSWDRGTLPESTEKVVALNNEPGFLSIYSKKRRGLATYSSNLPRTLVETLLVRQAKSYR